MSLELPFGVKPINPLPVDYWTGPYSGVLLQEAINAANSGVPSGVRYKSMEVNLLVGGSAQKYWYQSGVRDEDLVPFLDFSNESTYFTGPAYSIWTGNGLIFDVIYPIYFIEGVQYGAGTDQITLNSGDPALDRFDAIIVDSGGANFIEGTPAVNPVFPQPDSVTQLLVTYIDVQSSGTTPGGISEDLIYDENVEWTNASNIGSINFADTTDPFVNANHISISGYNSSSYIEFTDAATNSITDYTILRFYLKLGAIMSRNDYLRFRFYNGANPISDYVDLRDGQYNFDRTNSSTYQVIAIPMSEFVFSASNFDKLYIGFNGTHTGNVYLDYISVLNGVPTNSPLPDFFKYIVADDGLVTADMPNDTLTIVNSSKTGDKEITVTAGAGGNRVYSNISSDFSMASSQDVIFADSSLGPINVYIPTAAGVGGKEIMVKRAAGNGTVIIHASGAQLVDGQSTFEMNNLYQSISLISNNFNWFIS